jgi:hypothetical protein
MNTRVNRLYLLAALILAGCTAGERRVVTIQRHWPASAIKTIEVDGVDGSLNVEAGSADEVTLVAHVRSVGIGPKQSEENSGYFDTDLSGDTLRIAQQRARRHVSFPFLFRNNLTIDYELRVPATVALDMKMINGRIVSRGVDGAMEATTVNGPIEVETAGSNELSARTVNGSVHAKFLHDFRGARLKTVNGGIEALMPPSASFTCDLSQVNGDFEASFPLSIHSNPGSRRVSGQVNGGQFELQITTVNGDVEVQHIPLPPQPPPGAPAMPRQIPATPAVPAQPPPPPVS